MAQRQISRWPDDSEDDRDFTATVHRQGGRCPALLLYSWWSSRVETRESSNSSATEDVVHLALWLALVNKVRVWINRVASEMVFQPFLHPETGASMHVERVNAAADLFACSLQSAKLLQMECGHSGKLPVDLVRKSLLEVVIFAWKLKNAEQPVVGLCFHPSTTKDVDHGVVAGVCDQGAILDQSCRQQCCVSAFGSGHWRTIARVAYDCSARN